MDRSSPSLEPTSPHVPAAVPPVSARPRALPGQAAGPGRSRGPLAAREELGALGSVEPGARPAEGKEQGAGCAVCRGEGSLKRGGGGGSEHLSSQKTAQCGAGPPTLLEKSAWWTLYLVTRVPCCSRANRARGESWEAGHAGRKTQGPRQGLGSLGGGCRASCSTGHFPELASAVPWPWLQGSGVRGEGCQGL